MHALRPLISRASALVVLALLGCIGTTTSHEFITASQLATRLDGANAPVVLDVRSPDEFHRGHVPGAINIPHRQVGARLDELSIAEDRDLVVYCEGGQRTEYAESVLRQAGFTRVYHLQGDMSAWRQGGFRIAAP
jgi:rhodanese-related sulfurtransferase